MMLIHFKSFRYKKQVKIKNQHRKDLKECKTKKYPWGDSNTRHKA